jgi:hypothetical protein
MVFKECDRLIVFSSLAKTRKKEEENLVRERTVLLIIIIIKLILLKIRMRNVKFQIYE